MSNHINNKLLILENNTDDIRVFISSENINVFPCSRRGQKTITGYASNWDPEARLNTERTNRLHTAINGFTDDFIVSYEEQKDEAGTGTGKYRLIFVLAGYYIEIKDFNLDNIIGIEALNLNTGTIYAHLSLHDNIPLDVSGYYTELLYKQSSKVDHNLIDVEYSDSTNNASGYFFMGVSFTSAPVEDEVQVGTGANLQTHTLASFDLPLFSKTDGDGNWQLVQTSLLPKIEHGETTDSIVVTGKTLLKDTLEVKGATTIENTLTVTKDKATSLGGTLTVAKAATFNDTLTVEDDKATSLGGTLSVAAGKDTTLGGALSVAGNATLTSNLAVADNINVGNPTNKAESDNGGCIVAEKDITAEQDLVAKRNVEATMSIKTPTLDVEIIKNDDTEAVTIDDDLSVAGHITLNTSKAVTADRVNVYTINSRQEKGTITVTSPVILNGNTTLNNGLEVTNGDTSLKKLTTTELAVATDALTVTEDEANFTKPVTVDSSLTANNVQIKDQGQVPALELYHFKNGSYQLRFKFNTAPTIIEEE